MNAFTSTALPPEILNQLSHSNAACILRLAEHFRLLERPDIACLPRTKLAAVLVLLYEQAGRLRVLLTTRSKALRTHPGQTALPGGKYDESDVDLVQTAFREAQEEVGFPSASPSVHTLGVCHPFVSLHRLLVTPVVALLTDPSLLATLRPSLDEVSDIFSHPLESILDPPSAQSEALSPSGSEHWPYAKPFHNSSDSVVSMLGNSTYRTHRFQTSASPIKGLSSDILITVAEIAYDRPPAYERYAERQLKDFASILEALANSNEST